MKSQQPHWDDEAGLPVPDIDAAWQGMKARLDARKRKRRVLPIWWFLGALLIVGSAVGWWLQVGKTGSGLPAHTRFTVEAKMGTQILVSPNASDTSSGVAGSKPGNRHRDTKGGLHTSSDRIATAEPIWSQKTGHGKAKNREINSNKRQEKIAFHQQKNGNDSDVAPMESDSLESAAEKKIEAKASNPRSESLASSTRISEVHGDKIRNKLPATDTVNIQKQPQAGTVPLQTAVTTFPRDSNTKAEVKPFSPTHPDTAVKKIAKTRHGNGIRIGAGLVLTAQIPLRGQSTAPYDYWGRSSTLRDYLPAVYVRVGGAKWHAQAEAQYGVPQAHRDFVYRQQTGFDSSSTQLVSQTDRLRKTYYHQLPLSINYRIHKQWSVGVGGVYSRFHGAIAERTQESYNLNTGNTVANKQLLRVAEYNDSFFYRSQWHGLVQAEYNWRRWGIGLRYTRDLQPFIRYTEPGGALQSGRRHSLRAVLRYGLDFRKGPQG